MLLLRDQASALHPIHGSRARLQLRKCQGMVSALSHTEGEEREAERFAKGNGPVTHRVFSLGVCSPALARDAGLALGG